METIQQCFCCGKSEFRLFAAAKDNYSGAPFEIQQCVDCGFIFTSPRPDISEIGKYYTSPDYMSHQSHSRGLVQSVYRVARQYMMRKKLAMLQAEAGRATGFSMLDFGCGTADFLGFVKQNGILAEGVEPDADARQVAKAVNQVETYSVEQSAAFAPQQYDVITLWHVLEHIHELHSQIALFHIWLKPGGKLIIAVPNIESWDAKKYGANWDAIDVPRHIYHFSPNSVKRIVGQHGFRFVRQYPLMLDAYYVSMRSEWHLGTGKLVAYFKGLLNGWRSNRSAKQTGQYSSLIYVFEKS